MPSRLLADVDALGIAPHAIEHGRADQPIVEHDIGLLQQLQRAQGQKVRIAGPGADQVDLAARRRRRVRSCASSNASASAVCPANTLEAMPPANSWSQNRRRCSMSGSARWTRSRARPARRASSPSFAGSSASSCAADAAHQGRRLPGTADRHDDRRAIDDRRHDARRGAAVIDHVDKNAPRGAGRRHRVIDRHLIGGGNRKHRPSQVLRLESHAVALDPTGIAMTRQRRVQGWRDDPHPCPRPQQHVDLAQRHSAPANDDRQPLAQVEEYWQIIHQGDGSRSVTPGTSGMTLRDLPLPVSRHHGSDMSSLNLRRLRQRRARARPDARDPCAARAADPAAVRRRGPHRARAGAGADRCAPGIDRFAAAAGRARPGGRRAQVPAVRRAARPQ